MLRRAFSTTTSAIIDSGNYQQELIKSYLRKTSNLFLCINSPNLADRVCETIGPQLIGDGDNVVFEASPGFGILTERLLASGIPKLRVFEHIEKRLEHLRTIRTKFGSRLEIVDKQILDFANGNYKLLDLSREDMLKHCFDGIAIQKNWSKLNVDHKEIDEHEAKPISLKFLTVLSPFMAREFLSYLVYSLSRFDSFFMTGPTEFFLFVPISHFTQMLREPSRSLKYYTAFTIHINSLFDFNEVDLYANGLKGIEKAKINADWHTVVTSEHFAFTNGRHFRAKENFVFLRMKPKSMVRNLDSEFLINYVTFVKQSYMKRSNYAIKYYEKHFPGCAVNLIGLGISYFRTFGDLTSDEMLLIFRHLYNTPQYQSSIFKELC